MSAPTAPTATRPKVFRAGDWLVEADLNRVSRHDAVVRLRPKVMDVLVCLAEHAGEVVSKEALLDAVWHRTFIGDSALAVAVFELREVFGDSSREPRYIETIPKRGYRLLCEVVPFAEQGPPAAEAAVAPPPRRRRRPYLLGAGVAVAAVVTAVVLRTTFLRSSVPPADARTRIAVLPFENLGPGDQEYFAAGLTDEITARLTSVPGLAVISSSSARRFAGSTAGAAEIGRQLGVDYILSGTVRWQTAQADGSSRTVRISPRLVQTSDDTNVWAEHFNRGSTDVLGVQAEIARQVVQRLGVMPLDGEHAAIEGAPTTVPAAYEAYLQGVFYLEHQDGEENQRLAVLMFERATELDPGFALAFAALSRANANLYHYGFDRTEERRRKAHDAVLRAAALASDAAETHLALASYYFLVDLDHPRVAEELAAAARLRPGDPSIVGRQAAGLRRQGRFVEAAQKFEEALDADPSDPLLLYEIGVTRTALGRYAEAGRDFARSIELMPDQHTAYEWSAYNTLLWKGSLDEAQAMLDRTPVPIRAAVVVARWTFALCAGDFQRALAALADLPQGVAALQSHYLPRSLLMAETYRVMGYDETARELFGDARQVLEREAALHPDDGRVHSALCLAYAGLGRREEALAAGRRALEIWPRARDAVRHACCLEIMARARVVLGDLDGAAEDLERLFSGPVPPYAFPVLDLDPRWAPLRSHPRYAQLLAQRAPEAREKASL